MQTPPHLATIDGQPVTTPPAPPVTFADCIVLLLGEVTKAAEAVGATMKLINADAPADEELVRLGLATVTLAAVAPQAGLEIFALIGADKQGAE